MVTKIVTPTPVRAIVEQDSTMSQEFRTWTQSITNMIQIVGTGSPEGVVDAVVPALYMDDAGTTGNILYVKRDADIGGDKTQGWILV